MQLAENHKKSGNGRVYIRILLAQIPNKLWFNCKCVRRTEAVIVLFKYM